MSCRMLSFITPIANTYSHVYIHNDYINTSKVTHTSVALVIGEVCGVIVTVSVTVPCIGRSYMIYKRNLVAITTIIINIIDSILL